MATPLPIEQASIGMADSIILMILALVVFGPRKLPQIGRQIGKLMYEFRKASNDFKFQMEEELRMAEDADRKQKEEAQRQKALTEQAAVHALPQPETLVDPTATQVTTPDMLAAESVPEVRVPRIAEPVSSASSDSTAADSASDGSVSSGSVSSGPVIQPPSTGETVAAAKPGAVETETGLQAAEDGLPSAGMESGTETVIQHG